MSFFQKFQKRRAINSYVRQLGPHLKEEHGKRKHYTPEQVRQGVRQKGLNTDLDCYAYAIFCNESDFNRHHEETGESCDYHAMREEVAQQCFHGDTNFDSYTALDSVPASHSSHHSSHGDSHHSHGDSVSDGGHSSSDGGGGGGGGGGDGGGGGGD